MPRAEPRDERQQRVHGRLVGADQHAPPPQVPQLAHRLLGLLRQPHQPLRILAEHAARLGQRALLGRAVEQPLAQLVLEAPDGLADRRLGAVQLGRGSREASLGATVRNTWSSDRSMRFTYK